MTRHFGTITAAPRTGASRAGRASRRTTAAPPAFRELDRAECEALLARNTVGRLAFSFHDHVDVEPLHYVYADGWLYGRTSFGPKLLTLAHNRWIAFEVDEVDGLFDWRSVIVRGAFFLLEPDRTERETAAWEQGLALLRALVPETGTPGDPVAFRAAVFRIHVDEMTGRAASRRQPLADGSGPVP
jgi:uncharacterized protein